jgi:hypothetical protein
MAEIRTAAANGEGAGRAARREAGEWAERLARFGYGAKGIVYLLVGGLAFAAAIGAGGRTTDSTGALASISGSAAGRAALAVVALGLFGYVIWSLVRAMKNPERDGAAKRAYFALTAVIYSTLALAAARLALDGGTGGAGSGGGAEGWSATLMRQPLGHWLLGIAGAGIALFGVQQLVNAWRVDLDDQLELGAMSTNARPWAIRAGRLGLAARGVVFGILGGFIVLAAVQSDPGEARGVQGVLDLLERTPALLAAVALGLAAFGVYSLVLARYRRIDV